MAVPSKDKTRWVPIPAGYSLVEIVSEGPYIAVVEITDYRGLHMRELRQDFGYHGELQNLSRRTGTRLASFVAWDMKDEKGVKVKDGVYLWTFTLHFKNGLTQTVQSETAVLDETCIVTPCRFISGCGSSPLDPTPFRMPRWCGWT